MSPAAAAASSFVRTSAATALFVALFSAGAWAQEVVRPGEVIQGAQGDAAGDSAIADVTGDGRADLVVGMLSPPTLRIYPGHGDGTFDAPVAQTIFTSPVEEIEAADMDGDGDIDIVALVGDWDYTNLIVFAGQGDGTFQQTEFASFAAYRRAHLRLTHVDSDGRLDAVVAGANFITVFWGDGAGAFEREVTSHWFESHVRMMGVAAGDLNGDHRADIALSFGWTQQITVLLSTEDRRWTPVTVETSNYYTAGIAIRDANTDGVGDLIVAGQPFLLTLPGNGDGTFAQPQQTTLEQRVDTLLIADFDGDGAADALAGRELLLGDGDGMFRFVQRLTATNVGAGPLRTAVAGRLNADSRDDVAMTFGDYVYTCREWNCGWFSVPGSVALFLSNAPPPLANAGNDFTVRGNAAGVATPTLDASASSDPEGLPLQYTWRENGVVIATGATSTAQLTGFGAHTIELTVSNSVTTATDTVVVTVEVPRGSPELEAQVNALATEAQATNAALTTALSALSSLQQQVGALVRRVLLDGHPDAGMAAAARSEVEAAMSAATGTVSADRLARARDHLSRGIAAQERGAWQEAVQQFSLAYKAIER